jgi:aspartyl-tRNA(Asn)/glutamyl-tRNA(Gln) amidotransferase subunit C
MTEPIISEAEVRHAAKLSRLNLSDEQIRIYTGQLEAVLEYVKKLDELDTKGIEPTAHAVPLQNVFRKDEARPGIGVEKVLQNAPDAEMPFFKVPKVLEDSSS